MSYCDKREHIFVIGSSRSGTSLISSVIQSSSEIASYRAETKLLNSAKIKYGNLSSVRSRKKFLDDWFRSRQFKRSGLTIDAVKHATQNENSYIGFLGIYMNMVAEDQGCQRWIDSTPSNANCLSEIAKVFPNAKIINMVRDGRAVALSLAKLGWSGVSTDDFDKALCYSALKWQSAVEKVTTEKKHIKSRLLEVKYEDFVKDPSGVMKIVSDFLCLPEFDLRLIEGEFVEGSESTNSTLRTPNSLFGDMPPGISTNAAYRWKAVMTKNQINDVDAVIGGTLEQYGYTLESAATQTLSFRLRTLWRKSKLHFKQLLKRRTMLGRFSISSLEINRD
jgi:hypothetical protein